MPSSDPVAQKGFSGCPDLNTVVSDTGERWQDFRKTLTPKFWVVWGDLAFCHVMAFVALVGEIALEISVGHLPALLAAPFVGLWVGFWFSSIGCFGHEAAHYNLAKPRWLNDLLANWVIMMLGGLEVKAYRKIHWRHHLHLGHHDDTETSYYNHPSTRFLLELVTGIYPVKIILRYLLNAKQPPAPVRPEAPPDKKKTGFKFTLARAALLNLAIIAALAWAGLWGAVVVWLVAFDGGIFFGIVRQILEHRAADARPDVDYTVVEQGPTLRMFPTTFLSRALGGAGFNRHLLHHWDPTISYTCFDDMEAFLMRTPLAAEIDAARSTYWTVLRGFRAMKA